MKKRPILQVLSILAAANSFMVSQLSASVLYSNLQGNYLSQQTSSIVLNKGTSNATGTNTIDPGATGFGDDYSVDPTSPTTLVNGVPSVLLKGVSFYGNVTPSAGNPAGSLGAYVLLNFYDAAGLRYPQAFSINSEFQGGIGLHTVMFDTPAYIPATGSFILSPGLFSTAAAPFYIPTPRSYGDLTVTGYFGGAPTVGTGNPLTYARTDTNGVFLPSAGSNGPVTVSNSLAPAYLQFSLIGVPEPASLALFGLAGIGLLSRRGRRNVSAR